MFYFLLNLIKKLAKPIQYCLPWLYCALYDRKHKWTFTRYVLSYILGICLAVLFWEVFVRNLDISLDYTYGALIVFIIVLGLGFVFTTAVKCIAFLACAGLVGSTGRSFLRALCFAYIISGPIANLALNGQEVARVFACTTVLTYNLTKTRFDLMTKPFQNTLAVMKDEMLEIKNNFGNIEHIVEPIKDEIAGGYIGESSSKQNPLVERFIRQDILPALSFADPSNVTEKMAKAKRYRDRYVNKMRQRCKEHLKLGEKRCKDAFANAQRQCMETLPLVVDVLLCWPLRINHVCNMRVIGYQETGGICDPSKAIDPKLGENFISLEEAEYSLFANATDVSVSYEVVKVKQPPQLKAAKDTAKGVMKEINEKKRVFDYVMGIMQKILSFIFVKVIYKSITYHKNYLRQIDFDNLYISSYFKKIDERRKEAGQKTLLPLKKFEQQFLVDTKKPNSRTKEESASVKFYLLKFSLEFLISGFFLLLDHMVVVLLNIIALKSEITYYQEGEHKITFHIKGSGLLARLMRKTLKNFNMHERVSSYLTNKTCLPDPSVLPKRYYMTLLGLYIGTLLLINYSSVTLRSRRYICSFFYRKREKQRILHLYNKMLKQRKSLFETLYQNVKDDLETHSLKLKFNLLLWLRLRNPGCCDWLRVFRIARRKCLICGEPEPRDPEKTEIMFVKCSNSTCKFIYCEECWLEMGEVCIACQSKEEVLQERRSKNDFDLKDND